MSKKKFLALAIGSAVAFIFVALLIDWYNEEVNLNRHLIGEVHPIFQIIMGAVLGLVLGLVARWLVDLNYFQEVKLFFQGIISSMNLSIPEIWLVSCCVGIGEELLFRGAVQPLLGVWATSVIFVALHGYLNPFNLKLSAYGAYMIVAIALLGFATIYIGLLSAMAAHAIIDVILLRYLSVRTGVNHREDIAPE